MVPPADHQSDDARAELVRLLRSIADGDRAAFSTLYQRTSAKLYGICIRLLANEAEAQEALQDAYVIVWQKADRFDPARAGAMTWLAIIARNKAIDRLRRRSVATETLESATEIEDDCPSAIEILEQQQDSARLDRCLDDLEDRTATMIRAAFLGGATYPELAERECVPLGTMKSWIRRGLVQLRGCLEQ